MPFQCDKIAWRRSTVLCSRQYWRAPTRRLRRIGSHWWQAVDRGSTWHLPGGTRDEMKHNRVLRFQRVAMFDDTLGGVQNPDTFISYILRHEWEWGCAIAHSFVQLHFDSLISDLQSDSRRGLVVATIRPSLNSTARQLSAARLVRTTILSKCIHH